MQNLLIQGMSVPKSVFASKLSTQILNLKQNKQKKDILNRSPKPWVAMATDSKIVTFFSV